MTITSSFIQKYMPLHLRDSKTDIDLWSVAHKFCVNSRSVSPLSKYISLMLTDKLFEEVLPSGEVVKKSFFSYQKKGDGSYRFYLIKDYKDLFLKTYSSHLKEKSKEIEELNPFCDIRYFIRYYKAGTKQLDTPLKAYILANAMHETYEEVTKTGKVKHKPIFSNGKEGFIIAKKGMSVFVERHQEALEKLGFQNLKTQLVQSVDHLIEERISVTGLATMLKIKDKAKLENLIHSANVKDTFLLKKQGDKVVFDPIIKFYRSFYMLAKEDLSAFVSLFSEPLSQIGADKGKIQFFTQEKPIVKKTKDMISIRKFLQLLAMAPTAQLNNAVKTTFLKETYYNPQTKTHDPVFVDAMILSRVYPVFASETAMLSFLKKNRSFFEKKGASNHRIGVILGEKQITPWKESFLPLTELAVYLKSSRLNSTQISKYCIKDTYVEKTNDGTEVEKPLFVVTRRNDKGQLVYAIDKKAVPTFVAKYAKAFNINPLVATSFEGKKDIPAVYTGFINLYQFWDILGRSYQTQYNDLTDFIKQIYPTEKFVKYELAKSKVSALVFRTMQANNKKVCLYMDEEAIPHFVKKHYNKLLEMGFRKNRLDLAMNYKPALFVKRPSGRFSMANSTRIKE